MLLEGKTDHESFGLLLVGNSRSLLFTVDVASWVSEIFTNAESRNRYPLDKNRLAKIDTPASQSSCGLDDG